MSRAGGSAEEIPLRHFLSAGDLTTPALGRLLDLADEMKADRRARWASGSTTARSELTGRTVAVLLEKPSLRTRVAFEVGVRELGGHATVLTGGELALDQRETVEDTGRVLARYVAAIVLRTFGQDRLERLAAVVDVPVINALSDREHPCQALADLQTLREQHDGQLDGLRLAYLGDGNNVAHSLLLAGALAGVDVALAHPEGSGPDPGIVARARERARESGSTVTVTTEPAAATTGAHAIYTDVWTSMGQEEEAAERAARFGPYQVTEQLFADAHPDAIFLHCLPAHRGEEVAPEVIDGPRSRVFEQAENRLHTQKALLATLVRARAGAP